MLIIHHVGSAGAGGGGAIVPMTVDQYGKASFDGILKQGSHSTGSGAIVHSSHSELLPKLHEITEDALKRPDEEELAETKRRTELAIGKVRVLVNPTRPFCRSSSSGFREQYECIKAGSGSTNRIHPRLAGSARHELKGL